MNLYTMTFTMRTVGKIVFFCIPWYLVDVYAELAAQGYSTEQDGALPSSVMHKTTDAAPNQDFYTRSQNIDSLLYAYRIIAMESGRTEQFKSVEGIVVETLKQAKELYQSNKFSAGREVLDGVYADLKNAIILLRDGQTVLKSRSADEQYDIRSTQPEHVRETARLSESIDTLMAAHHRVSSEKGQQRHALSMQEKISAIKSLAARQFGEGDYRSGNELLHGAYILLQEALVSLRDGDTLVQSLDFANIEAEYHYYERKTQSQITAINTLLTIIDDEPKKERLNRLLMKVQGSINEANLLAEKSQYEAAVSVMDKAFTRLQSGLMMALSV